MLTLRLFGQLSLQLDGELTSGNLRGRAGALLIYLAATRQPQTREFLANLLWENEEEQQARSNLRYTLRNIRKSVGDYVIVNGETVAFNQKLPCWTDVSAFSNYIATIRSPDGNDTELALLQDALNLYVGEFLSGFQIANAPTFESWMLTQRRRFHELFIQGLQYCIQLYVEQDRYEEALQLNNYLLKLEPWREEAHRQRMLLLIYNDQHSAALKQYHTCTQILLEELDVLPMEETTTLYEQIKSGQWNSSQQPLSHRYNANIAVMPYLQSVPKAKQALPTLGVLKTPPHGSLHLKLGAMPEATHFYGRQTELAMLHSWIRQEQCPLVAILGIGGQGKTSVAAAFVQEIIDAQKMSGTPDSSSDEQNSNAGFTHVIWCSLSEALSFTHALDMWLHQLHDGQGSGLPNSLPSNIDHRITKLFAILRERRCLLVLDGLETIMDHSAGEAGVSTEGYRPSFEGYDTFLRLFFQRHHRSCLLLTSQIRPDVLTHIDERDGAFRCLELKGLPSEASEELLTAHNIPTEGLVHQQLQQRYMGNPLLLNEAVNLVYTLFEGDVEAFLEEDSAFLGSIGMTLRQQIALLSPLERQIIQTLANAGRAVDRQGLLEMLKREDLTLPPSRHDYFHALQNLRRSYLIQQKDARIKLDALFSAYLVEYDLL